MHRVIAIALVAYATIATVLSLWAGRYLNDVFGLTGVDRGNALLVMSAAPMAGTIFYGSMDRVLNTRKRLVLLGAVATTAILAVLALLPTPGLFLAVGLLSLLSATSSYGVLVVAHGRELFPDHLAGRAMTTVNLAFFVGVSIMQPISGIVVGAFAPTAADAPPEAYRAVFAFLALATAAAILIYARAPDVKPRQT
jgi:sugar phosphate permease